MRIRLIFVSLFATMFSLSAQEQDGIVKTIGRPGHPGEPLEEVLVRVTGTSVASVTDHEGRFSVVLAHYSPGQAYSLSRVYKNGYQLADADIEFVKLIFDTFRRRIAQLPVICNCNRTFIRRPGRS